MAQTKKTAIKCTTCGKDADYFTEPLGPFCSARCQMVDLGKWFGEEYRVVEPLRPDHFEEFADEIERMNMDRPPEE